MTTYLIFEPPGGVRTAADAEQTVFVPERFSWSAFVLGPFWLLWHGLWLGLAGWLTATVALSGVLYLLGVGGEHLWVGALLPSAVVAFEASELRRGRLLQQGYGESAAVIASGIEEAEQRYFARPGWVALPAPVGVAPVAADSVVGLFPQPEARR